VTAVSIAKNLPEGASHATTLGSKDDQPIAAPWNGIHLGHKDALVNYSAYARIHGPTTVDCDAYDEGQIKYRIYRTPRNLHEDPR
jgi:hypothetical protein